VTTSRSIHGDFFDLDAVWSYPKPLQHPHPPLYAATTGIRATREALRWADGWVPAAVSLGDVPSAVAKFREVAQQAGREPADIDITITAWGDPTLEVLESYRECGVARVLVGAGRRGGGDSSTTLPFLDEYASLMAELR
jgi:alkanesulfonate monooxygenase SsuD/methylene tetrahydromethanopterin reductase-like flavin-dependent oxidoreductase (luciferase family)